MHAKWRKIVAALCNVMVKIYFWSSGWLGLIFCSYFSGSEGKLTQWNDRVAVLQG